MNKIVINGKAYEVEGKNISIIGTTLKIDGVVIASDLSPEGKVQVEFHGDLASLICDGSCECQNIAGNATVGGSLHCEDIGGNVTAGGSVHCGKIGGSLLAGGSIKTR